MKIKLILIFTLVFAIGFTSCEQTKEEVKKDLFNDEFPDAKKEILATLDSIGQSVKDGDMDKLISFHAYNSKFTEFKNGELRNDWKENERFERGTFSAVTEVVKFDMNDLKIAVFGDIANVTTHTDFHLKFGEDLMIINNQMSLLFLKKPEGWRIVHEHHSPIVKKEE